VQKLSNPIRQDAQLLSLLSGLRTGADGAWGGGVGVVSLRWEHVDWKQRVLRLPTTKTHRSLAIPLSTQMLELLERRQAENPGLSPFVFPADSATGHIGSLNERSGQRRRLSHHGHDMRAAYITYGMAAGVPKEVIQRLVGHPAGDVTEGYVNADAMTEFLRSAQQLISDHL
jgi:integrase